MTILRKLYCRHFKSWREPTTVALAPLTVIFGANGAGKSSLLQTLTLLQQTAAAPEPAPVVALDAPAPAEPARLECLFHQRRLDEPFELGLDWQLPSELYVNDPERSAAALFHGNSLELLTRIGWAHAPGDGGEPVALHTAYRFAGGELGFRRVDPERPPIELFHTYRELELRRRKGGRKPLKPPAKCYQLPAEVFSLYQNLDFACDLVAQLEARLAEVFFLAGVRAATLCSGTPTTQPPRGVGRHGELTVAALLAAAADGTQLPARRGRGRRGVVAGVGEQLRRLELADGLELRATTHTAGAEIWLRAWAGAFEVPLAEAGGGLAQVLPLLTLCACAPQGSTLLLETPETALAARTQADLTDILIETVLERDVQIVLTSQSQHLLRRLQRRIAEERLHPTKTALYFCTQREGVSSLEPLELDRLGTLASWPSDFFEHDLEELGALGRAVLERRTRIEA